MNSSETTRALIQMLIQLGSILRDQIVHDDDIDDVLKQVHNALTGTAEKTINDVIEETLKQNTLATATTILLALVEAKLVNSDFDIVAHLQLMVNRGNIYTFCLFNRFQRTQYYTSRYISLGSM